MNSGKGFSLLELSIVLVIMSVITGIGVSSGIAVLATARISATNQKIARIEEALMAFRIANDRLPCPAPITATSGSSTYGTETATSAACAATGIATANNSVGTAIKIAEGTIPFATLGLPGDFMYDGWGNRFRYAVDTDMVTQGSFSATGVGALCGGATVETGPNYPASTVRSSNATYVILSHGANAHGAYTKNGVIQNSNSANSDEQTNCHCDASANVGTYSANYVQESPVTQDTTNPLKNFDDIVVYKERWQLASPSDPKNALCQAVYVADTGNNRIQKLNMQGAYLAQFGSLGLLIGQFNAPSDVAVDKYGNIWVVDRSNQRVQKFNSSFTFISAIGAGYNGVSGLIGGLGTGNGQFNNPYGVAPDSNDMLWVSDSSNNRVQKFDSNNNYLFSMPGTGTTASSSNGYFSAPKAIKTDSAGNIWVGDSANNRIQKFRPDGTWLLSIGGGIGNSCMTSPGSTVPACAAGNANGQFSSPAAITLDRYGNVWVLDSYTTRMQAFTSEGVFIRSITVSNASSNAADSIGNIWTTSTNNTIQKCLPDGSGCTTYLSNGSGNGQVASPAGIFVTSR